MTHRSTRRKALIVAGIGSAAVVASPPANVALLAMGAVMAARALAAGAGAARVVPAAALVAIVVGAYYAPVKTIERVKARRLTMPKPAMTIAELRDPIGHGLPRLELGLFCCFEGRESAADRDDLVVRFASPESTVAEFIRAIEEQTPLRHQFMSCGNGGFSILLGRNCALGLLFREPDR